MKSSLFSLVLVITLILQTGLPSYAQTTIGAQENEVRSEISRIIAKKELRERLRENKRKKMSTKGRIKKLKNLADSTAYADYMVELGQVTAYAEKGWPRFEVYPSLMEAKKAFKEPYFTGGYYRIRNNLTSRFRQPDDMLHFMSISSWGYFTVKFLVDENGNILRSKNKTSLSPDIDEEIANVVRGLPPLHPAEFGKKKYPSTGTMVIEYEIEELTEDDVRRYRRKGVDYGEGSFFFKIIDYHITWTPAITPML